MLFRSQLQYHGIVHAGLSIEFYKARLDDAWSNLVMVQDNAQVLQQEFLASLLTEAKQADEKKKVAKLKAIQQAEYMRKLWPKLRKYAKVKSDVGSTELRYLHKIQMEKLLDGTLSLHQLSSSRHC